MCKHNSLVTKAPWLAAQWDYEANDGLGTPESTVAGSAKRIGWRCNVCGGTWTQSPNVCVAKGSGCPHCARVKRRSKQRHPTFEQSQHPLLAQWDFARNAKQNNTPSNTTLSSAKQIFWLCSRCPAGQQHSWSAKPFHRTARKGTGCPCCTGRVACACNSLQVLYPSVAAEWDYSKNEGQPSDYAAQSHHLVWWQTPQRGSWQQKIAQRTAGADLIRAGAQMAKLAMDRAASL